MNKDQYQRVLQECSLIATEEYNYISSNLQKLRKELSTSKQTIEKVINLTNESNIESENVDNILSEINDKTSILLDSGLKEISKSLQTKRENLSEFTVSLFGRTKAGKSTIREALTQGDGTSIGKGAQRTTRDVKAYKWNKLRILDTPGFDAYNGEEDEKVAFSYVDQTDLILFLITSDSIEESEFEKLARLRTQNKPVIILLNVLYDLNHPLKKRKILQNPKEYVSHHAIRGHLERLNYLSKKYLNIQNIDIIPIHARAAYESNISESEDEKKQLYIVSNFEYFNRYLINMIQTTGKQKRIQSFRDDYVFYLESNIKSVYWDSFRQLIPTVKFLRTKHRDLSRWFKRFIPETNEKIDNEFDKLYAPLFNQLDGFVDQYIEDDDFGSKWESKVKNQVSDSKLKKIQESVQENLNNYLNEFYREFKADLDLKFSKVDENINSSKKDWKGTAARWGGATLGTAGSSILYAVSTTALANSWNPVGWGLAAVAVGIGIFAWFQGSDTKNFNKQKAKTKTIMFNSLDKMKRKNRAAIKNWFYDDITKGLKKKITEDLLKQIDQMNELLNMYREVAEKIENSIEDENLKLFERLLLMQYGDRRNALPTILKIVREQGQISKMVINNKFFFPSLKEKKEFEKIVGEKIIDVQHSFDEVKFLIHALGVRLNMIDNITYNQSNATYLLKVNQKNAGLIFGAKAINLKLAEKIVSKKIKVEVN